MYILFSKGDNNYLPFQETLTKVTTNYFKIDIGGLSGPLEIYKNILSA